MRAARTEAPAPAQIRRLAPDVAEAIAAGEVIERPASVVKELVENALDAGANRIVVELEEGGRDLIRVSDDGWGMAADQLALAFERHATSKLSRLGDLESLSTLGFRGEALASIAAVAQVSATSREPSAGRAHRVEVGPRGIGGPEPAGAPPGTSVSVRGLFANLPARRSFLRSSRSEASACARVVADAALGSPLVSFELRSGGRQLLLSPGDGDELRVLGAVFGTRAQEAGLRLEQDGVVAVRGVICAPPLTLPDRRGVVVFVNGRRLLQRSLAAAIEGAYRGHLEVNRHPVAVVHVSCDLAQVDVNVHPTKREVRFRDEGAIFEALQRACWVTLQSPSPGRPPGTSGATPGVGDGPGPGPHGLSDQLPLGPDVGVAPAAAEPGLMGSWRYLGQAHNRYLVTESEDGLALLDQHAAHEKVLYESYRDALDGGGDPAPSQGLIEPILVEVPGGSELGAGELERLERVGFLVEAFGEATLRCTAAPAGLAPSRVAAALAELLEPGPSGGNEAERSHRAAALLACHAAVRFGDALSEQQAISLLTALSHAAGALTCPHGRPVRMQLSDRHLRTAFRRP